MAIGLVKGESSLFIELESTEGTYAAPSGASAAIEVLEDGLEFSYSRDEIERNTLTSTIESVAPRLGLKQVSGTVPTEFKASGTQGEAPREDKLYRSLLGARRQITSEQTSDNTTHTSTVIYFADTSAFNVGDIVLVKEAGAYEVRPISAVTTNTSITFPIALENGAPSAQVVVAKTSVYYHDENAPTLSATHYLGGKIEEKIDGLRCVSASIDNWSTASVATVNFALEGLNLNKAVATPSYTPDFSSDALPPVLLNACIWLGGVKLEYNEFSLSIENTKAEILSACSDSGKISSRFTNLSVSGSINPYMEDDDIDRFNSFNNNDTVSIFGYAYNPSGVTGEGQDYVAFYLPQCKITEIPTGDQDGILTDSISFKAFRGNGNDTIFLGFI